MVRVALDTDAAPQRVLEVLHDPRAYARWVVGTRTVLDVEDGWPVPGSAFVHEVGIWPLKTRDRTRMVRDASDGVILDARAQPLGRARVEIRITPNGRGGTLVELDEEPTSGPARFLPRPLLDPITRARNRRSLARLRDVLDDYAV